MEKDASLRTIDRALDVLDCFHAGSLELSLTEISRRIGLAMSTTSRILATLEKRKYLARHGDSQLYYLGTRLVQIGALGFFNMDVRRIAAPHMTSLSRMFNEGVSLYVVMEGQRVCVERVESTQALRRVVNVGDRYPLTRGAAGRVLLAYLEPAARDALLAADPFTDNDALDAVRRDGYTVSQGEREEGVTSIAAPVFNVSGDVVAAIAMSGPTVRFTADFTEKVKQVLSHARAISEALGVTYR